MPTTKSNLEIQPKFQHSVTENYPVHASEIHCISHTRWHAYPNLFESLNSSLEQPFLHDKQLRHFTAAAMGPEQNSHLSLGSFWFFSSTDKISIASFSLTMSSQWLNFTTRQHPTTIFHIFPAAFKVWHIYLPSSTFLQFRLSTSKINTSNRWKRSKT